MKNFYYTHKTTKQMVDEEDAEIYALEQNGIKIEPKGIGGTYTIEQLEIIEMIEEYFYSDWQKVEYEVEEI